MWFNKKTFIFPCHCLNLFILTLFSESVPWNPQPYFSSTELHRVCLRGSSGFSRIRRIRKMWEPLLSPPHPFHVFLLAHMLLSVALSDTIIYDDSQVLDSHMFFEKSNTVKMTHTFKKKRMGNVIRLLIGTLRCLVKKMKTKSSIESVI